ncbi:MAG: abortive infection family protein [Chloroflexi bacterium]|nr:abortive infection family protein [Chloroflexota bacterium]
MAINPFIMHGSREILDSMAEPPKGIEVLVDKAEQAISEESPDVFDYAKTLVESTCKTILTDRGIEFDDWEAPKLFKETQKQLNYVPPGHPNPVKFQEFIKNVLFGLDQVVKGLAELRNLDGIISHGKDGYREIFFTYHLQLAARSADAIVHFLFSAHRKNPFGARASRIYYEDNPEFNDYVDEYHEATVIFEQVFPASKVLFDSDRDHTSYREMLEAWQIDKEAGLLDPIS